MVYEGIHRFEEWSEKLNDFFIIRYHPERRSDVREILECAKWVRNKTQIKYPHNLGMKVTITLCRNKEEIQYLTGNYTHGYSHVNLNTAEIFILYPSWSGKWGGYESLDYPFRRVLNHEYVHCPFWQERFRAKLHGGYKEPEGWFYQGIAEYISENFLSSYKKRVKESVAQGRFNITDDFSWGLYIVEYMYKKFHQNRVLNLIRSESSTFNEAIQATLGVNRQDFDDGWKQYLIENI